MNPWLQHLLSRAYDGSLAPEHLADLRTSGLTEKTIAIQFIRSVPPTMIPRLLGFDIPCVRSAMLLPFRSPAGAVAAHLAAITPQALLTAAWRTACQDPSAGT